MSEQPVVYGYSDIKQQVDHYVDIISHPEIYSKVGLHGPGICLIARQYCRAAPFAAA